jgi:hypothetical protein
MTALNISKENIWPIINHNFNVYYIYDIEKQDRCKYLNVWFNNVNISEKLKCFTVDDFITLVKVDKESKGHLCGYKFNPLSLKIMCPLGAKFNKDENDNLLYNMKSQIYSIDDSSYGIWWYEVTIDELRKIRLELMNWISSQKNINGELFLNKCVELGADIETKDYN